MNILYYIYYFISLTILKYYHCKGSIQFKIALFTLLLIRYEFDDNDLFFYCVFKWLLWITFRSEPIFYFLKLITFLLIFSYQFGSGFSANFNYIYFDNENLFIDFGGLGFTFFFIILWNYIVWLKSTSLKDLLYLWLWTTGIWISGWGSYFWNYG